MLHHIQSRAAALTVFSALTFAGVSAQAGTLQIRDRADVLTPADESALRNGASSYPFDVRVLTDTTMADRASFERYVASQLASPNMVVLGIDPTHRWTAVHFGTSTRVATNSYSAIENAGDPYFRGGRWNEGVNAILGAAQSSVGSGMSPGPLGMGPAQSPNSAPSFPWGMVIFGLVAVAGVAFAMRAFRRTQGVGSPFGSPYRSAGPQSNAPYGNPGYGNPGYGNPGYGPGYGPAPGSGLGTGLAGAALGGLAGYAIGNAMHDRDDSSHAGMVGGGNDASPDAGGSSSGWDDGGGGGGGGDFGGGGGDGGGGGGDW